MVVRHTIGSGSTPGTLAGDGETYTGFGYLTGGAGSDHFTINNNSTLNAWLQTLTGNDTVLLDSGGVISQWIQGSTYTYENTLYEIYNNSVDGIAPRQTIVNQYVNTGDSNDTVIIDGSGYAGTDQYAISIGAGWTGAEDLATQGGNDNVTITDGVLIAGGVSIGAGQDTLTVGPDVRIEGDISSANADNMDDNVTIAEGATITGGFALTSGDDTLTIAGTVGDGTATDRIAMGEGENDLTITSTAVVNVSQIVMGSNASKLTVEQGANVTLKPGNYTGEAVQLSAGNDVVYLAGVWDSSYNFDVWDGFSSNDSITMGADFSATNTGTNSVFKIHGGGNAIALDNDTLDITALLPRVATWTPDPANAEHGVIVLDDSTVIEYSEIESVITCFARGTRIATETGCRAIEDLRAGDLVLTQDNGLQLKWSQKTGQSAKVYPQPLKGYENGEAPEFHRSV